MPSVAEISCPNCEKVLKVPENVLGKRIKCKHCEHTFVAKAAGSGEPAVKASKPGGAVKAKKEESKPEPKAEAKPAPPPAPAPTYKFQEDEEEEGAKPNPLGVIDEGQEIPRCPHCAQELDPPDAKVCVHCGFNNVTRVKADSKKVWAPSAEDYFNHLGPGILALLGCIGLIVLVVICWINMRDWMTGTFLQKDDKDATGEIAFYVKPGAFITFVIAAAIMPILQFGRFAIKRLAIENQPPEQIKK